MTTLAEVRAALAEYDEWNADPMSLRDLEIVMAEKNHVIAAVRALPADGVIVHLQPDVRLVRVTKIVLDEWGTRTADGRRVTAEWGEPDDEGCYTPTFTATDDGSRIVTAESLARALVSALGVDVTSVLPDRWTAAILAALAAEGAT